MSIWSLFDESNKELFDEVVKRYNLSSESIEAMKISTEINQNKLKDLEKEIKDPEKAKAFLQSAGFLDKNGKLASRYGGDGE